MQGTGSEVCGPTVILSRKNINFACISAIFLLLSTYVRTGMQTHPLGLNIHTSFSIGTDVKRANSQLKQVLQL